MTRTTVQAALAAPWQALAGHKVLFVDGVNAGIPSGGRTATDALLSRLTATSKVTMARLAPSTHSRWHRLGFAIANLPGVLALMLYRLRPSWTWLEWCTRASPFFALYLLMLKWRYRPDAVVLNHHATFAFAPLFGDLTRYFVWHDVPSAKRGTRRNSERHRRLTLMLERAFARRCSVALTYSFDEGRRLRRLHRLPSRLIPAFAPARQPTGSRRHEDGLLMVGGWGRPENVDGALEFFRQYLTQRPLSVALPFRIAGQGAEAFARRLTSTVPGASSLALKVTPRFDSLADFGEWALIAPIARGAGIKLKTLEAWAAGLPVLGTAQAFTGIPPEVARTGGLRLASPAALAMLCRDPQGLADACARLDGSRAWRLYAKQVGLPGPAFE